MDIGTKFAKLLNDYEALGEERLKERLELIGRFVAETDVDELESYCFDEQNGRHNFKSYKKHLWMMLYGYMSVPQQLLRVVFIYVLRHFPWLCRKLSAIIPARPPEFYKGPALRFDYDLQRSLMPERMRDVYSYFPEYERIFSAFADDMSRSELLRILMYRLTFEPRFGNGRASLADQYFSLDILPAGPHGREGCSGEVFADCGGFTGDTMLSYIDHYGADNIKNWYLYEPDTAIHEKAALSLADYSFVKFRPFGVSDGVKEATFNSSGDGSSYISDRGDGGLMVRLVTLDEDIKEPVTFIKMDIEGSELAALRGAREHIVKDKPVLTICVYHRPEDIHAISDYILSLNPEYKLYLRHHAARVNEIVLYAV